MTAYKPMPASEWLPPPAGHPGPWPLRPPGAYGEDDPGDPAYALLLDDFTSTPVIFRDGCYICEDPEFAQMGLPLCSPCARCGGHIPADDEVCDDCEFCENPYSQDSTCMLAPEGFPGHPDDQEYPFGDYETTDITTVRTGTLYDGSPALVTWLRRRGSGRSQEAQGAEEAGAAQGSLGKARQEPAG